jgi:phospholipid-binding lipoprotein MlaA
MRLNTLLVSVVAFALATPSYAMESLYAVPAEGHVSDADISSDPLRGFNEPMFDFNVALDRYFMKPVVSVYHHVPSNLRHNVDNFVTNLSEPLNVVHGVLQLNPNIAFTSMWRFILNSTFGLAGLRDFAGENGLHNKNQNFGKTIGRWGVGAGPYIVLPLFGPSSARDAVGKAGDFFLDPIGWIFTTPENIAEDVTAGIDMRDKYDAEVNSTYYESLNPYVAMRSTYRQHEAYDVERKE